MRIAYAYLNLNCGHHCNTIHGTKYPNQIQMNNRLDIPGWKRPVALIAWLLRRESLNEVKPVDSAIDSTQQVRFFHWLMTREELPGSPVTEGTRGDGLISFITRCEHLPRLLPVRSSAAGAGSRPSFDERDEP